MSFTAAGEHRIRRYQGDSQIVSQERAGYGRGITVGAGRRAGRTRCLEVLGSETGQDPPAASNPLASTDR